MALLCSGFESGFQIEWCSLWLCIAAVRCCARPELFLDEENAGLCCSLVMCMRFSADGGDENHLILEWIGLNVGWGVVFNADVN